MDLLAVAVGGFLAPIFWASLMACVLWFLRRFFPRSVPFLFGPAISNIGWAIGLLVGRICRPVARLVSATRRDDARQGQASARR